MFEALLKIAGSVVEFLRFTERIWAPFLMVVGVAGPVMLFFSVLYKIIREKGKESFEQVAVWEGLIFLIYLLQMVFFTNWADHPLYSMVVSILSLTFAVLFLSLLYVIITRAKNKIDNIGE